MSSFLTTIGLMSGTSADGIDGAILVSDGVHIKTFGPVLSIPYSKHLTTKIKEAMLGKGDIDLLERELTIKHAELVEKLLTSSGYSANDINLIGFHGQTVMHRPKLSLTRQLGDGALLSTLTNISVACDFRRPDLAQGGEGAPLVPIFHSALCEKLPKPLAVVNIGGVANVTWIGVGENNLLACDTGPGNAIIDDLCNEHFSTSYDKEGKIAAQGKVDDKLIEELLSMPYFSRPAPKSLDRSDFNKRLFSNLAPYDAIATATAFTATTIAKSYNLFPEQPKLWIICGGGAYNPILVQHLRATLGNVETIDKSIGITPKAIEAYAFAYLAARAMHNLPYTFPTTTGCKQSATSCGFYPI